MRIDREQVGEISTFLGQFISVFKENIHQYSQVGLFDCKKCQMLLHIGGAIEGWIVAEWCVTLKSACLNGADCAGCIESIISSYTERFTGTIWAQYHLSASGKVDKEALIYQIRREEPVMSLRIKTSEMIVELFVKNITSHDLKVS